MRQYISLLRHSKIIPILVIFTFVFQLITEEMQAWTPDNEPDYQYFIMPYVKQCNLFEYPQRQNYVADSEGVPTYIQGHFPTRDPLKWWVNCLSYKLTDSAKTIPIIFNVAILPLTYLIAVTLTRDRLIGMIAVSALILNPIYTRFEGSGTYDQIWSFFLLLSAYLLFRIKDRINMSIPSFLLSLAAKALGIMYLPAWLYTLHKTERSKQVKWILVLCLVGVIMAVGMTGHLTSGQSISFHPERVELAISQNIKLLWEVLPVLIVAVGVNRLLSPKQKVNGKGVTCVWMLNALATTSMIYLFTDQLQFVYRFMPFLVFMSVYLGMVIVESGNKLLERKLSYKNKLV